MSPDTENLQLSNVSPKRAQEQNWKETIRNSERHQKYV